MKQIGIYVSDNTDIAYIDDCLLAIQDIEYVEKFFISDGLLNSEIYNYMTTINIYNAYHFNGIVLFLNKDDFNKKSSSFFCEKILVTTRDELIHVNKDLIKHTEIYIRENDKIRKIKNAELQPILR